MDTMPKNILFLSFSTAAAPTYLKLPIFMAWKIRSLMSLFKSARAHWGCLPIQAHASTSAALRFTCSGVLGPTSCSKQTLIACIMYEKQKEVQCISTLAYCLNAVKKEPE